MHTARTSLAVAAVALALAAVLLVAPAPPASAQAGTTTTLGTPAVTAPTVTTDEPPALNAGGLVFFGVVGVLVVGAALLYLRNRSRPASGRPENARDRRP